VLTVLNGLRVITMGLRVP